LLPKALDENRLKCMVEPVRGGKKKKVRGRIWADLTKLGEGLLGHVFQKVEFERF